MITREGDRYLAWWVEDLRETDRVLHHFLETYDSHMEGHAIDSKAGAAVT